MNDIFGFQSGGGGTDVALALRVTTLEDNELKITYYEVISGTSGSLTVPTNATINEGEFGLSGNAILSKIDGTNKPTYQSPLTAGGVVVTASLNATTGAWVSSGVYTDTNVALIYSIKIKTVYYNNLNYNRIIDETELSDLSGFSTQQKLSIVSSPTIVMAVGSYNKTFIDVTALAVTSVISKTGTPANGDVIYFQFKDNGTSQAISWSSDFENKGFTLPTATPAGKRINGVLTWDSTTSKFGLIDLVTEVISPSALGTLTTNPFNSNQWTVEGSSFWTFAGSSIEATGGSTLTDRIILKQDTVNLNYTDLVNETITIDYQIKTLTGSGMYCGWEPKNTYNPEHYVFGFNPSDGKTYLYRINGVGTWVAISSSTALSISVGNVVRHTITLDKNILTCTILNVTTSATVTTLTYTNNFYTNVSGSFKNLGVPAIYVINDGLKVTAYNRSSLDNKNVTKLSIGTSQTQGYHGGAFSTLWSTLIGAQINAGGSESTTEVLLKIPQILSIIPTKVYLEMGLNDFGNPSFQSNYNSIVSQLEAAGIVVIKVGAVPGFPNSIATNSFLLTTYPSTFIDISALESTANVLNPIYDAGDNHLNLAGNVKLKSIIIASGL